MPEEQMAEDSAESAQRAKRSRLKRRIVVCALAVAALMGGLRVLTQAVPIWTLLVRARLSGDVPELRIGDREVWMPAWFYVKRLGDSEMERFTGTFYVPWRPKLGVHWVGIARIRVENVTIERLKAAVAQWLVEADQVSPESLQCNLIRTSDTEILEFIGRKGDDEEKLVIIYDWPKESIDVSYIGTAAGLPIFSKILRKNGFPREAYARWEEGD
jgi:hypothetical protein